MKFKNALFSVVAIMALGLVAVGCSDDDDNNPMTSTKPEPTLDIVETAAAAGNFNTLLAAAQAADLVDALKSEGPLTVFAPTDDAFAALPEGTVEALLQDPETLASILTYHVVPGEVRAAQVVNISSAETLNGASITITVTEDGKVMIDNATVIATDIETTNGIIHVIDAVILPGKFNTSFKAATASVSADDDMGYSMKRTGPPIYGLANKAGLTTLATAIEAVGLNKTLNTDGPFTVFAPTNEAFAALPEGTLEALLQDPEALTNILLYHVVAGEVKAADVVNLTEATMLNGQKVSISVDGGVMVNDANVIKTDVMAKNGVVHVIDKVLIP
jgi:uncharacterized surface protein with fasciclin (FAS1) repeats